MNSDILFCYADFDIWLLPIISFFTIAGFFLSFFLFIFFLSSCNDEMWSLQLSITLSCNDETWRFFCLSRANEQYLSVMPIGGGQSVSA